MTAPPAEDVRCDLVIPVFDALRSTRACLASVARFAPSWTRVVVVNDASGPETTAFLRAQKGIVLLENETNLGFVKSANRGLLFSEAPWVCLLNSDTLLTEGALQRMLAGCEKDPSIALATPLSNGAVNLSVKMPEGEDVFSFARRVGRTSPALYPDAVTVVGFCLLVKRDLIVSLGVFDEIFGRGYCEETDLHYRARVAGRRCVVADDVWIHHRHGGSFTDGDARTAVNMKILMGRWREAHDREIRAFDLLDALGALRDTATHEWILPDDRPAVPHDLLVVVPPGPLSRETAARLELTNELVLAGFHAGAVALDGTTPENEMELWFRPLKRSRAALVSSPPATRAWITDENGEFSLKGTEAGQVSPLDALVRRLRSLLPF